MSCNELCYSFQLRPNKKSAEWDKVRKRQRGKGWFSWLSTLTGRDLCEDHQPTNHRQDSCAAAGGAAAAYLSVVVWKRLSARDSNSCQLNSAQCSGNSANGCFLAPSQRQSYKICGQDIRRAQREQEEVNTLERDLIFFCMQLISFLSTTC